jgi:hypothetical protein
MKKNLKLAITLASFLAVHLSFTLKANYAQPLPAACPNASARFLTGREFLVPKVINGNTLALRPKSALFCKV